jgi:hypothetical protein
MNMRKSVWLLVSLSVAVVGCPKSEDDGGSPTAATTAAAQPAPTPAPLTTSAALTPQQPAAQPGIEAKVKAEVDNRADGIAGTIIPVTGAKAAISGPKGWAPSKSGNFSVVTSADKKAQLAAAGAGPGDFEAGATALGLTGCKWNPAEPVTVGKDKLAGSAADGLCQRAGAPAKAAYVALTNENLMTVGAWDDGGDSASVFGAMRSIVKAAGGGDASGIAACCAALAQNAKSAPPEQQGAYAVAIGACNSLKSSPEGRQALASVRAALGGAKAPGACQ